MTTIALLASRPTADLVFAPRHWQRLQQLGRVVDARFDESAAGILPRLAEVDCIVTSWGMPQANPEFLRQAPKLRGIFYAAGSVKGMATPELFARGIVLSSAARMNAIPVAEYTLAVILLSNKRFWAMMRDRQRLPVPGNYRRTIGIIAASMVGRELIRLLQSYAFEILLYDPLVDAAEAARLGVRKVELPELMAAADIVSLHAPNLPQLRQMIDAGLLKRMKDGATFINTARGALVDEAALLAELQTGRISAVLDVTDPEPPLPGSPLYHLPNVIYTPHIAGSMDQECHRLADFAVDELTRFLNREPLQNAVLEKDLSHLA